MSDVREGGHIYPQTVEALKPYRFPYESFPRPRWDFFSDFSNTERQRVAITLVEGKNKTHFDYQFSLPIDPNNPAHLLFAVTELAVFSDIISRKSDPSIIQLGPPIDKERLKNEEASLVENRKVPFDTAIGIGVYMNMRNYARIPGVDDQALSDLRANVSRFVGQGIDAEVIHLASQVGFLKRP